MAANVQETGLSRPIGRSKWTACCQSRSGCRASRQWMQFTWNQSVQMILGAPPGPNVLLPAEPKLEKLCGVATDVCSLAAPTPPIMIRVLSDGVARRADKSDIVKTATVFDMPALNPGPARGASHVEDRDQCWPVR